MAARPVHLTFLGASWPAGTVVTRRPAWSSSMAQRISPRMVITPRRGRSVRNRRRDRGYEAVQAAPSSRVGSRKGVLMPGTVAWAPNSATSVLGGELDGRGDEVDECAV